MRKDIIQSCQTYLKSFCITIMICVNPVEQKLSHGGLENEYIARIIVHGSAVLKIYVFGGQHGLENSRNAAGQEWEYLNPTHICVTLPHSTAVLILWVHDSQSSYFLTHVALDGFLRDKSSSHIVGVEPFLENKVQTYMVFTIKIIKFTYK